MALNRYRSILTPTIHFDQHVQLSFQDFQIQQRSIKVFHPRKLWLFHKRLIFPLNLLDEERLNTEAGDS